MRLALRGWAHLRKSQKGNTWRLRHDDAPAERGGYNERKRDRHALRCSHVTLLTCSYPPHAVRAPQILQLSGMCPQGLELLLVGGFAVHRPEDLGGGENVRSDDFVEETGELAVSEVDALQGFEFFAEVLLKRSAVADVRTIRVFEVAEL